LSNLFRETKFAHRWRIDERFVRDTNAYRVIFSEGDFLPGLIVETDTTIPVRSGALPGDGHRANATRVPF
jgi:hypothetical protein